MWTEKKPAPYPGEPWGFDNGAFPAWLHGRSFPSDDFLHRLTLAYEIGVPYLAVAPDLVAQGQRSLDFSLTWREALPDDWPWYLAVQDGMVPEDVIEVLEGFAGLFLGGTLRFKSAAGIWQRVAAQHRKRFHYGRAGTLSRVEHAKAVHADSLDSSFPLWTRERMRLFVENVVEPKQPLLPEIIACLRGIPLDGDPLTGCAP